MRIFVALGVLVLATLAHADPTRSHVDGGAKVYGPPGLGSPDAGLPPFGSLPKEAIREVIRSNIGEIRGCYENALVRKPQLHGKVAVRFVIDKSGSVSEATRADSTVDDDALVECVTSTVMGWVFPEPQGGGVVVVTYPFIFKQSSGEQDSRRSP